MRNKLILPLFCFVFLPLHTLSSQLDSLNTLKIEYDISENDTLLFDVVQSIINIHTKKGNLKKVDSLYLELDAMNIGQMDLDRQATYYTDKVKYYGMNRKFDKAESCVQKAITINQERNDTSKLINNYGDLATIQMLTERLSEASKSYFSALDIATSINDTIQQSKICTNLSSLFYKLGTYTKGIEYAKQSIRKADIQNHSSMAKAYTNLSINLYKAEIVTVDSVISIMQKTIELYAKVPNKIGVAKETNNIGTMLWKESRFEEALPYLKKAEKYYNDIDKEGLLQSNYISQGKYYVQVKDYSNAELYFRKALSLNRLSLLHKLAANEQLGHVYRNRNQVKLANKHYREALMLKDSNYHISLDNIIFETEAKYETEKKEQEILLLQKDKELKIVQLERQSSLIGGIALGLIGSAFGLFYLFRARKQEKELYEKDIALLKLENKQWYDKVQRYRATKQKIAIREEDVIKINGDGPTVSLVDIQYVQSNGNYVNIFVKGMDKPILLRYPLSKFLEEYLPQSVFIRINNRTIINLNYIIRKKASAIFIVENETEKQFNIGRTFKDEFLSKYDDLPNG